MKQSGRIFFLLSLSLLAACERKALRVRVAPTAGSINGGNPIPTPGDPSPSVLPSPLPTPSPLPNPSPLPTPSLPPSPNPTPVPTPTATPTASPLPTPTPSPTFSPTPTPVVQDLIPMYRCPQGYGSLRFLGGLFLGGGVWGFYGCQGQLTPRDKCLEIEYPAVKLVSCTFAGNLRVAKVPESQFYDSNEQKIYECPHRDGGSLGGGAWGYYGCQGQFTPQSTCTTIESPKMRTEACTYLGKIKLLAEPSPGVLVHRCPVITPSPPGESWSFYGCDGQLSPENSCGTIHAPTFQDRACPSSGVLPLE